MKVAPTLARLGDNKERLYCYLVLLPYGATGEGGASG